MAITNIDEQKLEAFIGHAATELGAALNAALVTLGDELGLYSAMADGQPVTPAELAARTGTQERYVREWLNVQAAERLRRATTRGGAYVLPPEHALVLADETSPFSMTGSFQSANAAVAARERAGRAVRDRRRRRLARAPPRPLARHRARVRDGYRTYLVADGCRRSTASSSKLEAGARVADVGCGHGASTILMAQAFPARASSGSTTTPARSRRRASAPREAGVADRVTFEVAGAADYAGEGYDLVAFFDSFHDLGDPLARRAPRGGGAGPRRHLHAGRAVRRRPGRGEPQPDRARCTTGSRRSCARPARCRSPAAPGSAPRPARPRCARCCGRPASARSAAPPRRR